VLGSINAELGANFYLLGKHSIAIDHFTTSLNIYRELNIKLNIAEQIGNIGAVKFVSGNFTEALEKFQEAIAIYRLEGYQQQLPELLNNVAMSYQMMGNFENALRYLHESLDILQKRGNVQLTAILYTNIGKLHHIRGDFDNAYTFLRLAYQLKDSVRNIIQFCKIIYYIILLSIDRKENNQAKEYLKEFEELAKESTNKLVQKLFLASKAHIYKNSKRNKLRVEAENIFRDIIDDEVIDFDLTIDSILHLTELLLFELKKTENIDLLKEIKQLVQKLLDFGEQQHSTILLVESYWIKSQIALIENNLSEARYLLQLAENKAIDLNYHQLLFRISNHQDELLNQMEVWERLVKSNAPLIERMDKVNLEKFVTESFRERFYDLPSYTNESPVMILILKPNGTPIYSRTFETSLERLDDSLVSGFLTAINKFIGEAFESPGSVERIKHKEYTILLRLIDNIQVCYIFKGLSYAALNRLSKLIAMIQNKEAIIKEMQDILMTSDIMSQTGLDKLDQLMDKVFIKDINE
jgi:Flp pilus assembly protein TadD